MTNDMADVLAAMSPVAGCDMRVFCRNSRAQCHDFNFGYSGYSSLPKGIFEKKGFWQRDDMVSAYTGAVCGEIKIFLRNRNWYPVVLVVD